MKYKDEYNRSGEDYVYIATNRSNYSITSIDFPYLDSRARRIGVNIRRFIRTLVQVPKSENTFSVTDRSNLGSWYVFEPHATRDGMDYGRLQHDRFFRTEEAREYAIAKYLSASEKRASKGK
jgi:hypothetical protein